MASTVLLLGGLGARVVAGAVPRTAEDAITRFETGHRPEEALMDPLLLLGPEVIPALGARLQSSYQTPRRRYAVAALGHLGDQAGVPLLMRIAGDDKEDANVRCDAVRALSMLDENQGKAQARQLPQEPACSSRVLRELVAGEVEERRTMIRIFLRLAVISLSRAAGDRDPLNFP